jgi:hypothetical protein
MGIPSLTTAGPATIAMEVGRRRRKGRVTEPTG